MKVTMKDIANKLGISINAVSIALNDKPGVSDEMRLEILKMADKMGYMMTTHVINKGYQRIGFFGDLDYSFSFEDRFIGFKQSLLKNNIVSYSKVDEYIQKYSFLQGIEEYVLTNQIDKIIEILNTKKLPEVLVCANDSNAFAVITALKDMGLKVPKDISVVGFDDTPLCVKSVPQITTVQVQKELMGEVAVSNLIDRIHRKDNIPMTQLLSVKIVERTSLKI